MPIRIIMSVMLVLVSACTTVHDLGGGRYIVPRVVEARSPFGTNMGFVMLERCRAEQPEGWFTSVRYTQCTAITKWKPMGSQGQGGQIAEGAMVGLGFGLGSAFAATSSVTNTVSSSASSVARTGGRR